MSKIGDECPRYDDEYPWYNDECPRMMTTSVIINLTKIHMFKI